MSNCGGVEGCSVGERSFSSDRWWFDCAAARLVSDRAAQRANISSRIKHLSGASIISLPRRVFPRTGALEPADFSKSILCATSDVELDTQLTFSHRHRKAAQRSGVSRAGAKCWRAAVRTMLTIPINPFQPVLLPHGTDSPALPYGRMAAWAP